MTPDDHSFRNWQKKKYSCTLVMDAENPDFPDGTFDVIVSRNLTDTSGCSKSI